MESDATGNKCDITMSPGSDIGMSLKLGAMLWFGGITLVVKSASNH